MINRYTVIGQPVAHSLSPFVHQLFGELTQRKIHYTRTEASPENFAQTVIEWQKSKAKGCNITAPFKQLAFEVCDRISAQAKLAGSVNTIHMHRDGSRIGYTTDGPGLLADIQINKRTPLAGKRILLLGAGGAARGVIAPLLEAKPSALHIANRTTAKALALVEIFRDLGPLSASGYNELNALDAFDVIINATTLGLHGGVPPLPASVVSSETLAYDMTYATADTDFMKWAESQGARTCNGLGMLVEQAAESYFIWEGVRPKTRLVYPRLQKLIS